MATARSVESASKYETTTACLLPNSLYKKKLVIKFGREICGNLKDAESREWLVTNGIGSYGAGTVSGIATRRYHGLLLAALEPPLGRTLLLSKLDETVTYNGDRYNLFANRWEDGTVSPEGYRHIESFHLDGTIPVWTYACGDALLQKSVWMHPKENTTYIRYSYQRGTQPLQLDLKALVNHRDHHGNTHVKNDTKAYIEAVSDKELAIKVFEGVSPWYLSAISESETKFNWAIANEWYRGFAYGVEIYRGLDATEDLLFAATGSCTLQPGDSVTIIASTKQGKTKVKPDNSNLVELFYRRNQLQTAPQWIQLLVLAADQFIVDRTIEELQGKTIIAGYPWFGDWGRDTMISLPGLTLATGRYEIAELILRTFARYIDGGMLPNLFPDGKQTPEYNTVDATLWYFEAIRDYYHHTGDRKIIQDLYPALAEIIRQHRKGTRYNIHLDDDGLIYAGEAGIQLTWMDAKAGDWVVTPRIGKPVEINALWYNALVTMAQFAKDLGKSATEYEQMALQTRSGFGRFWHQDWNYCYDVLDTPNGNDDSLRPNQIFAVSLPVNNNVAPLLSAKQQQQVVDTVARHLLTSHGMRSLNSKDPQYVGIYQGSVIQRDGAYHQGTVWSWLIGHFVQAHLKVYQDPKLARSFILPMENHLREGCIGSVSEIFDGEAPFISRGAFAQAWGVAEVLRSWLMTNNNE